MSTIIEKTITAEDSYTEPLSPHGSLNVSISGTFAATVRLQRRFQTAEGGLTEWRDVLDWSLPVEDQYPDIHEDGIQYRLGCKAGEYTSGSVIARLSF